MTPRRASARQRPTSRRWHIPPPLVHGPEALEGGNVLQELAGEAGVVLWQSLRDVMLWAATPPSDRGEIFAPGGQAGRTAASLAASLDPKLEFPLQTLAQMVGEPTRIPAEQVSLACRQVAQWAESKGKLATAVAFAQDAALVCPADASAALYVGRLAREAADHPRAEVWFRRTIGLARQARNWTVYTQAFLGLGNLYVRRGNFPMARHFHTRALRGARRGGLRHLQGMALHELFGIAVETGQVAEAQRLAQAAFEAYGSKSARLPGLARDVAYFWNTQGLFAQALAVLEAALPRLDNPFTRLSTLSDLARAAGGTGNEALFNRVSDEVWQLLDLPAARELKSGILLDLAHGAASLGRWEQAERAGEEALRVATERAEGKIRITAEALLESVRRGRVAATQQPRAQEAPDEAATTLAASFVESLKTAAVAAG